LTKASTYSERVFRLDFFAGFRLTVWLRYDLTGLMTARRQGKSKERFGRKVGDRNRARILDAAIEVFALRGYDGTRIAEIAERSHLPKANVYYYFRTKRAIYETIIGNLVAEWDAALAQLDDARDPGEALSGYIRAKLEFSRKRTAQSRMFANEVVHGGRFLSPAVRRHMHAATAEKAKVFQSWIKAGLMDPVDPLHLFILLWGATQFYADFAVMAKNGLGVPRLTSIHFDAAAETVAQIVLKGCGIRLSAPNRETRPLTESAQGSLLSRSVSSA
jgi:TetR/AcrR family transcriptional regulator